MNIDQALSFLKDYIDDHWDEVAETADALIDLYRGKREFMSKSL